jgi:hypothetical protein
MSDATRVRWVRETEHLSQKLKSQGMEPLLESLQSLNPLSAQERDADFVDLRPSSQIIGSSLSAHPSENPLVTASPLSSSAPPESPRKIAATEVTQIHKQGFLLKRGGKIKSWKRRYFILNDHFLYYYASPKVLSSKTTPKKTIADT